MAVKVLLAEGLGFGEQSHLLNELALQDISAETYDFEQAYSADFKKCMESSSMLVLRSRWSASIEENLLVRTLVKKHHSYFEAIDEMVRGGSLKLVAVGRGALLWLEWLRVQGKLGSQVRWSPESLPTGLWVDSKIYTKRLTTVSMRVLLSGRATISGLNLGGSEVRPWVEFRDQAIGWVVNRDVYLSLVDVFALSERAQLPDYGYEDLSAVATRSNLVRMLLDGEM